MENIELIYLDARVQWLMRIMLEIRGLLNVTLLLNVKQLMLSRQSLTESASG